ncbi:YigZ family protein [Peptoniphilus sp. AGMB00490]|uniref:YigZ family protein n=1 Tax=Peptoniphilus faecalis TaxID=2731255 RepID=A0A848RCI2_9FIRM|nr:YigZ family protein [Peptoniphilus faecalis]NMW85528.1 YigZ family protein [Peptoniphilus faecalis]
MYNSILKNGKAEIEIKKSIFIGRAFFVKSEDEALEILKDIKELERSATHNCHAYIIGEDGLTQRYSDNGEPSGTAGIPMLEVLKKEEMKNVLVIVTRYFGGTKLGAGGLVRAYTDAVVKALDESKRVVRKIFTRTKIIYDYTFHGAIINLLANENYKIIEENYIDKVEITIDIGEDKSILDKIRDMTSANFKIEILKEIELPTIGGKIIY